jgi:NitT/TauT family transport system substrate-binding protein
METDLMRRTFAAGLAAAGMLLVTGCWSPGTASPATSSGSASAAALPAGPPGVQASGALRLGIGGDLTDAPALIGLQMGFFGQNLSKVTLEPQTYTSEAGEVSAIGEGLLDAAYLDPVTALQAWQASPDLLKIVAGAAAGGAELVVSSQVTTPAQLKGKQLAPPAGGTEQAAADHWLQQQSLPALTGNEADGAASADSGILQEFTSGKITGGWELPPLNVEMTAAGGQVLVNEASQWADSQYPTAVLVVTQQFLTANPDAVTGLLEGQIQADNFLTASPVSAQAAIVQRLTTQGNPLSGSVISQSLAQLSFTDSPLPASLAAEANNAVTAGLLKPLTDLASAYDLTLLNQVRQAEGQQPISAQ